MAKLYMLEGMRMLVTFTLKLFNLLVLFGAFGIVGAVVLFLCRIGMVGRRSVITILVLKLTLLSKIHLLSLERYFFLIPFLYYISFLSFFLFVED